MPERMTIERLLDRGDGRRIVSMSDPPPTVERYNAVSRTRSLDEARRLVVDLENAQPQAGNSEATVGLIVVGQPEVEPTGTDPERVVGTIMPRVVAGGAIGAIVGAVVGIILGIVALDDLALIAPALAGAALFAVFGVIWAVFAGFGGSDAYRQTYVAPEAADVALVTFHCDDRELAEEALERMDEHAEFAELLDDRGNRLQRLADESSRVVDGGDDPPPGDEEP